MTSEIEEEVLIGKGTWLDRVASEIVERERNLGRNTSLIRVESGLGASGIPHIGSLGDAARAYGVKLALEQSGYASELLAYSDDMDALRKVPAGLPEWLNQEIAKPVSEIRDPYGCHASYGAHMSSLLKDGMDRIGLKYTFQSGYESYKKGLLVEQIDLILKNADKIGEKIKELTGQEKYLEALPYFPQCSNCHRLNVAKAVSYDSSKKLVHYRCSGDEIGKKWIEGCGHEGDADITKGDGKLSWKVEFAARWAAFDVRYEAHGKELTESVRVNDWISEEILNYPPPYHVVYELFQDKSGKKISKSVGNLVTPQKWLTVASPSSLLLAYFKRIVGARNISEEDVPNYMDEVDSLEDLYFGKSKEPNKMKEARLKGLYFYSKLCSPPSQAGEHVSYRILVELARVAPSDNAEEYIGSRLLAYRLVRVVDDEVRKKISYALNWSKEYGLLEENVPKISLDEKQRQILQELADKISGIEDPETIQGLIFTSAKSNSMEPSELFKILYLILLGTAKGPRLGVYIHDIGVSKVKDKILAAVESG